MCPAIRGMDNGPIVTHGSAILGISEKNIPQIVTGGIRILENPLGIGQEGEEENRQQKIRCFHEIRIKSIVTNQF